MINLKAIGRVFFAIPIVVFGIQYLAYGRFCSGIAAGAAMGSWWSGGSVSDGIASKIQARLGARLLGLMFFLWTMLLHAPRVFAHIHNKDELTSLFVALAMSGGSFIVAGAVSDSRYKVRETAA